MPTFLVECALCCWGVHDKIMVGMVVHPQVGRPQGYPKHLCNPGPLKRSVLWQLLQTSGCGGFANVLTMQMMACNFRYIWCDTEKISMALVPR